MTEKKMRKLYIQTATEEMVVEMPSDWKVTFGPFYPSANRGAYELGNALRIYETKEKQRACFREVVSFRDITDMRVAFRSRVIEVEGEKVEAPQTLDKRDTRPFKFTDLLALPTTTVGSDEEVDTPF